MKPKNYKLPADAYEPIIKTPVKTPEVIEQALRRFKEVDIASEQVSYADMPTFTGAVVTTEDDIKAAVLISFSPQYENMGVSFIPCNIPVAFSAKEALEYPYNTAPIMVPFGDNAVDRLYDAIHETCMDAHEYYLEGLLDLDDQLEIQ